MSETVWTGAPLAGGGLTLIGCREYLDFPEWRLRRIRAKVDTGACTSAIDVVSYELKQAAGGGLVAALHMALNRRHDRWKLVETPVLRLVGVRSSSGVREERPVVEALVRIGPLSKRIQLTVTNRARMCYRMLLGREALAGSFLVDVSKKYLWRS
jgi:hypothetical protein